MEVPTIPDGLNISYDIDHYVINWNASTPGSYPIGGYRVYRSKSNDGYWKYIATTTDLSYNDFVASPDTVYYYTVTSFDDQTATSASDYAPSVTTGIQDVPPDLKAIMVYPNPANDKITIECAGNQSLNLSVYNIVGEILLQKELNKSINEIDISSLSKGVYLIKITDASETVQQKLIKE